MAFGVVSSHLWYHESNDPCPCCNEDQIELALPQTGPKPSHSSAAWMTSEHTSTAVRDLVTEAKVRGQRATTGSNQDDVGLLLFVCSCVALVRPHDAFEQILRHLCIGAW